MQPPLLQRLFSTRAKRTSNERKEESGRSTSVRDEIERSKVHWSQLTEHSTDSDDDEVAEVSNVAVFKSLQKHPTYGQFFEVFDDHGCELVMGKVFAEGGQAEICDAYMTMGHPEPNHNYVMRLVLKVFKKGTFLRDLQKQWPQGLFRHFDERAELRERGKSSVPFHILNGTLLRDGRFAFLMIRSTGDLRDPIRHRMKGRTRHDCGPFSQLVAWKIMEDVAQGMDRLHNLNIVHRDLNPSNVLFTQCQGKTLDDDMDCLFCCYLVADFECSSGVVGTGFFRAPEILQAVKDRVVSKRPDLFTKAGDVYSYGMTCYEILTGKLPFEEHATNEYDLVLKGERPEVPNYVDEWARNLLSRCWLSDPEARPTFAEILNLLEACLKKRED